MGNRGFSLVEVVIAMAVIVIVSAAVISLILASHTAAGSALDRHRALSQIEDVAVCYRISEDEADFESHLAFALGLHGDIDPAALPLAGGHTAKVTYAAESLTVLLLDPHGREVHSYTYKRGVAGE